VTRALLLAFALAVPGTLTAQDPRLAQRLGVPAADSIAAIIHGAEREGLPSAPLTAKALEGAGRGAPAPRVIQAVTNLVVALRGARAAFGDARTTDELVAGAAALQNGVSPEVLRQLAHGAGSRSVAMPLVVLTDLASRGVPGDTIAPLITAAWQRGITEGELLRLRETISRDIAGGAAPQDAARFRLAPFAGTSAPAPRSTSTGAPRP
jgi:hypothetical protein